jgi:prophage maintenance system killer protein
VSVPVRAADLRFVNRVAARRCAGGEPGPVDEQAIATALGAAAVEGTPFVRIATLAAVLLQQHVFASAPLPTALLVVHCALALEGFVLIAPQGVTAGMIREVAADGDAGTLARWLEDRAVPSASG